MRKRFDKLTAWASAILCLVVTAARSTTVVPPTFEEMADRADLIFIGQVVGSRTEWRTVGSNRVIFTMVEFETQDVLKGNTGKKVALQFLGGTIGDLTLEVPGVPRFSAQERVVLFVEKNGSQFCPLVGVYHGKFGAQKDESTGREVVFMHNGKPLRDVAEIGAGEGSELAPKRAKSSITAGQAPLSVDDFKAKIQDYLRQRLGQMRSK